ncbi:eukaryotic translation initiation factor 4 gamma 1-like [Diadema setosum]|uniref:eukaryotic translation initiation factor 4 gamma 1-like n=1 Tax=Diadema setosum TaxID=31175 RepID=UPI003B3B514A
MSYPTAKGKGVYYQQQHPQQRIRYPGHPRPEEISPRQPRYNPQQPPRPQHPVPSQSPRVPSPSVSPVAVNALPHDMNSKGAPNRPGMAASPQQGILPNQPQPGAPMMGMNVRYPNPRGPQVSQRYQQPQMQPQNIYPMRHQNTAHMQGIQHHHQAGGPTPQQGGNTPQLMAPNTAASGQYITTPGAPPYALMTGPPITGPVPIVQPIQQHRQFQQSYSQQVFQPQPPFYSSPPAATAMWLPTQPTQPAQRPYQQQVPSSRPENQRNKKLIRIVDPTTNQDVTDTLMRDASGSNSPHSGRSSANVTPPAQSTNNEDAKRIQAQFAASVAMAASEDIKEAQRPAPAHVQQQPMMQQQQQVPQQVPQQPPPSHMHQGMAAVPLQQKPVVQGVVPGGQPVIPVVPVLKPGAAPMAMVQPGQFPSQPVEPVPPEAAQVHVLAATPAAEEGAQSQQRPPAPQAVQQGAPPVVEPANQPRMPAAPVHQVIAQAQPVPVAAQPPHAAPAAKPSPPAVPAVVPSNQQTVPPPQEATVKTEPPAPAASQDAAPAVVATPSAPVVEQVEPVGQPVTEAKPEASQDSQVDGDVQVTVSSANTPSVQPQEPPQSVPQADKQETAAHIEGKDNKKKSQKKRMQELDKKPVKDSDDFSAFTTDGAPAAANPESQENPAKQREAAAAQETPKPKEAAEKVEERPVEKLQTTQPPKQEEVKEEEKEKEEEEVQSEKTDEVQSDVAKRKAVENTSEKAKEVVPETTPAKVEKEEPSDRNEAEEWEKKNEVDTVESENSKNKEGKPIPTDNKIQLKYTYRKDQWSPVNPEGKKQYDRDFLLQFQKGCTDKPDGLPNIPDIVLEKADVRPIGLSVNTGISSKGTDFMPHFMKSPRTQGKAPNYQQGPGKRASREHIKVIQRASPAVETKLNTTEKAWKPVHKREEARGGEEDKTDELFRNFKSILNKLTPQRFTKLVEQAQKLPIDTEERLIGVISLVFEKAISEPSFSTAYAHMCQRLSQLKVPSTQKPNTFVQFRPILLHNCQQEFQKESQTEEIERERRKEIEQLPVEQRESKLEELEEQLYKAKRRTMGNIRFIGELFKLRILTENIMHDCILRLMKAKDDESLECLCNLMSTIGKDLDHDRAKNRMDQYFVQIDKIILSKKNSPRIRFLMCDLVDLRKNNWVPRRQEAKPTTIDAIHREFNAQEAKKAEEAKQLSKVSSRSREQPPPPTRTGPPQADDGWNTVPSSKSRPNYDPSKLKLTRMQADDNVQLGPGGRGFNMWTRGSSGGSSKNQSKESASSSSSASQDESGTSRTNRFSVFNEDNKRPARGGGYGSRDSRGRGQSPSMGKHSSRERERERDKEAAIAEVQKLTRGRRSDSLEKRQEPKGSREKPPAKPAEEVLLPADKVEQKAKAIVDEFLNLRDFAEAINCVSELPSSQRNLFVEATLDHIIEKKREMRENVGVLFQTLIVKNLLTNEQYLAGLKNTIDYAEDMAIDIPKIWEYLGEIQGAMLVGGADFLKLQAMGIEPLCEINKAGILLAEILKTAVRRNGASKVAQWWQESGLQWEKFLPPGKNVQQFVQQMGVQFTLEGSATADNGLNSADARGDWLQVLQQELPTLLKEKPDNNNEVFDWLERMIPPSKKESDEFIRALVTIICRSTIKGEGQSCHLACEDLKRRCTLLQRYVDNKRQRELQALYAVQALNQSLMNPPSLLGIAFDVLYDEDVVSEEAFYDWKRSDDPREQQGKGVALKSVTSFFTWLAEAD